MSIGDLVNDFDEDSAPKLDHDLSEVVSGVHESDSDRLSGGS